MRILRQNEKPAKSRKKCFHTFISSVSLSYFQIKCSKCKLYVHIIQYAKIGEDNNERLVEAGGGPDAKEGTVYVSSYTKC